MIIPLVILTLLAPVPQTVEEIDKDSDTSAIEFDHGLLDVNGDPVVVDAAEFIFRPVSTASPPPPAIRVLRNGTPIASGASSYPVKDLFATVPLGEYTITVRVRNALGAWSDENGTPLRRRVVSKKPTPATNLREGVVGGS